MRIKSFPFSYTNELSSGTAEARGYGIPPVVVIQQVIPVAKRTRRVSVSGDNEFSLYNGNSLSVPRFRRDLRKYAERHGLDSAVTIGCDGTSIKPYLFWFYPEDRSYVLGHGEEVGRKQNGKEFQFRRAAMQGNVLGYPECCINAYVGDMKFRPIEDKRLQKQLIDKFVFPTGLSVMVNKSILPVFFAPGFYPCRPDCEKAMETGNKILSSMKGEEYEAYSTALLNNLIMESGLPLRYSGLSGFREVIRRHFENEPIMQEIPVRLF